MKNKRTTAAIAAAVVLLAAGCGAAEAEVAETPAIHVDNAKQQPESDVPEEDGSEEEGIPQESIQTDKEMQLEGYGQENESEQAYLPGKVREVRADSILVSRTFIGGEPNSSQVYVPEKGSADEELVTVRFADDADFEHWTIKGGGAEIERREASFSDITEDAGLESYGYYDGDVFVAQRVIIEIDV